MKAVLSHVGLVAFSAGTLDWATEILAAFGAGKADPGRSLVSHVLTQRERDVLVSLKIGRSNKSIARELDITDNAVKFHLKNVYRKLGVNDRRLVLVAAEKRGLSDLTAGGPPPRSSYYPSLPAHLPAAVLSKLVSVPVSQKRALFIVAILEENDAHWRGCGGDPY